MRNFGVILIMVFCAYFAQAQSWGVQTSMYVQPIKKPMDNRFEGASLQVNYKKPWNEKINLLAGLEGQINSWGNHVFLIVGGEYTYFTNEKWSSNVLLNLGNGFALFEPMPLYSFNTKGQIFWNYHTRKQNNWGIGVGVQFLVTPKYKNYSSIYSTVNMPITLRFNF